MNDSQIPETAAEMGLMQAFPAIPEQRVTLSNWTEGAYTRWGFLHASELVPAAEIYRGSDSPSVLKYSDQPDLNDIRFSTYQSGEMSVAEMLSESYTDGFMVLHQGKVVSEQYFNDMQPHSKHLLQSVTKSVTGTLACILIDEETVNPDKLVEDYIPELSESGYGDATVRQVLNMTASILYREEYGVMSQLTMHECAAGWRARIGDLAGLPESQFLFLQSLQKDPEHKHGERFAYASCNTDVLGWILERAANKKLTELLSEKIWSKLGAEENACMLVDNWGSSAASGGLNTTLRDLARFGQMILQGGEYNGNRVIDSKWIDDIRFKGDKDAWKKNNGSGIGYLLPEGSYRAQWWMTGLESQAFYAAGIHGQHIYIAPEAEVVIVKLSSQPEALNATYIQNTLYGCEAIAKELSEGASSSPSLITKIVDLSTAKASKS